MGKFTNQQKFEEARREVSMRRSVYRNRVAAGTMLQSKADEFIELMQEIADDYRESALKDKESGGLFAGQ